MGRWSLLATALAAALAGPAALAQEDADRFSRGGLYASISAAIGVDQFGGTAYSDSTGFNGRAGWRATPRLALEAEFEIHGFDFQTGGGAGPQFNTTLDTMLWTTNVKGFLLTGRFQPYLQAGAGLMAIDLDAVGGDQTDVNFATRFGAGIDVYLTDNVSLTVGGAYVLPFDRQPFQQGAADGFDHFSFTAGIQYILRAVE